MSLFFNKPARLAHLVRGAGGLSGEIAALRADSEAAFAASEQGGLHLMSFVRVDTLLADPDGIKAAVASIVAPTTYTAADFDGALAPGTGPALINSPKRVTLTVAGTGTPANWTGGTVTVVGTASDGSPLEEDMTSAAGAGTATTVNYFATVAQVELPANAGTGASLTIGVAADTAPFASFISDTVLQVLDAGNAAWHTSRVGRAPLRYARRISFVFSNNANWDATTLVVRGTDIRGRQQQENIAIPNNGNATVTTTKFYLTIDRITVPVQSGTAGTCDVTFLETEVGLDIDPISDVEAVAVIREASRATALAAWAVPTAGVVDDSSVTNAGPYGRYIPNAAAAFDGVREHVLVYIPKKAA